MEKSYLLGFDAGTYESKGTLCDIRGNVVATAFAPHLLKVPKPGYAEHDPMGDWWMDFKKIVKELLEKSGVKAEEIAGVGISTVMAGITPVDENCEPLRNAILYGIDSRSQKQVQDLKNEIGEDVMMEKCGAVVDQESFGPKIRWIHDNEPEIFKKTRHFTIASGFLTARLTGEYYVDRYSASAALPMYDTRNCCWNEELTPYVCSVDQLPRVAGTTDVIGRITREAALETGLAEGTPVITGTTDAGAEAVSVGVTEPGDMMLMYGSTMFVVYVSPVRNDTTGLSITPYTISGNYALYCGMATTGSLTRWIRDQFGRDLLAAEEAGGESAYAALAKEAAQIPAGSDGLIVLPYFLGERMPIQDPNAKGVIFGLNLRHTRGHIMKAAYEGMGYGLDQNLSLLRKAGLHLDHVVSVGGGTKAPQWLQTISDVCGIRQTVPEITIGASYGDAMLAGVGIGALTAADIKKIVKVKYVTEPNMANHAQYEPMKKHFAELYKRNADIMHQL